VPLSVGCDFELPGVAVRSVSSLVCLLSTTASAMLCHTCCQPCTHRNPRGSHQPTPDLMFMLHSNAACAMHKGGQLKALKPRIHYPPCSPTPFALLSGGCLSLTPTILHAPPNPPQPYVPPPPPPRRSLSQQAIALPPSCRLFPLLQSVLPGMAHRYMRRFILCHEWQRHAMTGTQDML
jgi:hypothetical protein